MMYYALSQRSCAGHRTVATIVVEHGINVDTASIVTASPERCSTYLARDHSQRQSPTGSLEPDERE